jgi:hypothetical protein
MMGCGWCGAFIPEPYCDDDGAVGLFYCPTCEHFNMLDRIDGHIWRIRNGKEPAGVGE